MLVGLRCDCGGAENMLRSAFYGAKLSNWLEIPIYVGLGLLLDANQIPVWMKLYPGNESEKPILRDVIKSIKDRDGEVGRTIHVADKGLNCAENIAFSKTNKDGYIFSKSVKQLPEKEKVWVLSKNDWKSVKDSDGNILYKYKSCIDEFPYTVETGGKKIRRKLNRT